MQNKKQKNLKKRKRKKKKSRINNTVGRSAEGAWVSTMMGLLSSARAARTFSFSAFWVLQISTNLSSAAKLTKEVL